MLDLDAAAQSPTKGPKVLQANDALDIRFSIKNLKFQFIIRFHGMVISNRIRFYIYCQPAQESTYQLDCCKSS